MMPISAARVVARKQWPYQIPGFAGCAIFSSESALLSSAQAAPRTALGNRASTTTFYSVFYTGFTLVSLAEETCKVSSVTEQKIIWSF